jgi:hypothetical protein
MLSILQDNILHNSVLVPNFRREEKNLNTFRELYDMWYATLTNGKRSFISKIKISNSFKEFEIKVPLPGRIIQDWKCVLFGVH